MVGGAPKRLNVRGGEWNADFPFENYPKHCADTREELLLHAIQQQKDIVQKAGAEIARLDALREVPVEKIGDGGWGNL